MTVNGRDEEEDATGLPASIEAAWGVRRAPTRGPKRGLRLPAIVEAGIEVARRDGLEAVSMARVAGELGVATMSLYRYVAAKDELLTLMVDAALGPPPPRPSDESWREGLERWAWGVLARYREHPWVLRIPIREPPKTPNQIAWLEDGLRSLADTGLAEQEKASVVLLLSGFVLNDATLAANFEEAARSSERPDPMAGYGGLLARLTDPERFPALHAVIAAGVFDAGDPPEEEFRFGLERILDGVAALVRARARP
jgi:AcrR family transcriptional regulator